MPSALRRRLSTGSRQADEWENACAVISVVLISGFGAAAAGASSLDWPVLLKIFMAIMLTACGCVVWSTNRIWDVPQRSLRRSAALWLARLQDVLEPGGHAEARVMSHAAASGALVVAVEAMARSDAPLAEEIANGSAAVTRACQDMDAVARGIEALTDAVRADTQHFVSTLGAVKDAAEDLSTVRSACAAMSASAAQIAETVSAIQAVLPQAGPDNDMLIAALQAQVAQLIRAAGQNDQRVQQLAQLVVEQSEMSGEALRRIALQGEAISATLDHINAAGSGTEAARRSLDMAVRLEKVRSEGSARVWREAVQFPGRAETIARLLRELPDFRPKARRQGM